MDSSLRGWFSADHTLPPSYEGDTFWYAISVAGLLIIFLLAAEWLWRTSWLIIEQKRSLRHPITLSRVITILLMISVLMRTSVDVFLTMAWPEISELGRLRLAQLDRVLDGLSAGPFVLAWFTAIVGGAMIDWQLVRQPVPINLWPTWKQLRRPIIIGAWIVGISFTVAYLR